MRDLSTKPDPQGVITPVLIAGCLIMIVGFGVRASFGVFQLPVAQEFGWARAEFSLAIAIQNLAWGVGQPLFSMIAERWGDRRALTLGALCYAVGLALAAQATTPEGHQLLNVVIGFGVAGLGFGVILSMVGRATHERRRSLALGIATAAGSAGQVVGPPLAEALLGVAGWDGAFLIFAAAVLATVLFLPLIPAGAPRAPALEERFAVVLGRALRDPSYTLIFLGFFSCGYQLAFVTAHFPAFVAESCGPIDPSGFLASVGIGDASALGAWALAVIGATNIAGTLLAGQLGARFSRKYLLSGIYLARTVVAAAFIMAPMTPLSVIAFSVAMGALWLATVPLTAGLVGHIYGLRYMGTLYGIVFFSHQLGSFLGVWLGGALYDRYGSYDLVWWIGVGVGAFSALVHLPVRERPLAAFA
ncbi:MFS transporter [Oceanicella actignis]|uniref:Predicted arabinose efflux permease, MFS family n=1 Tax=Oceanicella actignis TaxID=1189325 RepID=A0A1M7TA82_9RHOB|nr:Predicted arabinose efflux permease, MFS family [Oceanicella actignis]SHN67618.1 Predicted arabinose efflux permease, MFS family [Oceanicella actignis]